MNTAHFVIDMNGHVIPLGVGPDTTEAANDLFDLAESVARSEGREFPNEASVIYNIADLYMIIEEAKNALNNIDNDALSAPAIEEVGPTL